MLELRVDLARIKAVWPWLAEAKHVWLSLLIIVLALLVAIRPGASEPLIRLTGLILQLFGIGTVIWGISETRAVFGYSPIFSKTKSWLQRFPLVRRDIVLAASGTALSAIGGKARAHGTFGAGDNPTVEARLDAVEKNIGAIHDRITATQKEMDEEIHRAADALKREEQTRREEDAAIGKMLEATGTGGVHISAIGASWLFVGIVLSTAAAEIAALLR